MRRTPNTAWFRRPPTTRESRRGSTAALCGLLGVLLAGAPNPAEAGGGITRRTALLVTNIPERPVEALYVEIEIPALYGAPTTKSSLLDLLPGTTLEYTQQTVTKGSSAGALNLGLYVTLDPPRSLSGYLLDFRCSMPHQRDLPLPIQLRKLLAYMDNGRLSRDLTVALLTETGASGAGSLP